MKPTNTLNVFLRTSPSRRILEDLLSKRWGEFSGTVLEIGPGEYSHSDLFDDYVAIDIVNRKRIDVVADVNVLPFRNSIFDSVICIAVLEHTKEPRHVVKEMKRVLAPSGKLLAWVPFVQPMHDLPSDYFRFTREGITDILGNEDHSEIIPCGGFFSTIAFLWWGVVEYYRRKKSLLIFISVPLYLLLLLLVCLDRCDKEKRVSIGYLGIFRNDTTRVD